VRCDVPPSQILHSVTLQWLDKTKSRVETGNIRRKAIVDNDLEAYLHISDFYRTLSDLPILESGCLIDEIVKYDGNFR
jgi:hypothetical protein